MNSIQIIELVVMLVVITWAVVYFRRRESASVEVTPEATSDGLQTYIFEHGEPQELVVADPLCANELNAVVLVYEDRIVVGGVAVARHLVDDVTFNNASVPYVDNRYQLVVTTRDAAHPVLRMALGSDAEWASQVARQVGCCLEAK